MIMNALSGTWPENERRFRKAGKDFAKKLGFKDINCPVNVRDTHKIEEKNCIDLSVFVCENKGKYSIYLSKDVLIYY